MQNFCSLLFCLEKQLTSSKYFHFDIGTLIGTSTGRRNTFLSSYLIQHSIFLSLIKENSTQVSFQE